jgi:hypothetical protein
VLQNIISVNLLCSIVSLALEVSVPLDGLKSFSFVLQQEEEQQQHPYLLHKDSRICHHQLPFHTFRALHQIEKFMNVPHV